MANHAYKNKPMIPNIWVRDEIKDDIPMLSAYVTQQVLKFKRGIAPQQSLYNILKSNGFNNDSYKELLQLASDYFDYLHFEKHYDKNMCFNEASIKACEIYVANYIQDHPDFSTLPPGTKNFYQALINEYPELKRQIEEHHRSYGGNKGEKKVYTQQPLIPGQVYQDQMGNCFTVDQYGRQIAVAPQIPQQIPPEVRHAQSMMRRNNAQYAPAVPMMPPQPMGWGANPQYNQPMAQPMGRQPMYQNTGGGYTEYSQQSQVNSQNGVMTAFTPQNRGNVNSQPQQETVNLPPPSRTSAANWYNDNQPAHNLTQQHTQVQQPPQTTEPDVEQVFQKEVVGRKYLKTKEGYETDYYWTGADEWISNPLGFPVIYDANERKGVYLLDRNKVIQDLTFTKGTMSMDYDKHENKNLLKQQKRSSNGPDKEATLKALAEIQRKNYVEETLAIIMGEPVEGNVTGEVKEDVDLTKPVFIDRIIAGTNPKVEYILALRDALNGSKYEDLIGKMTFCYEYQHTYPIAIRGDQAKVAKDFKLATDWIKIRNILAKLDTLNLEPSFLTMLNDKLTKIVNDLLKYRLAIDISIDSFDTDIEELIDVLDEQYGQASEFKRLAKQVATTVLNVVEAGSSKFDAYFGVSEKDDDSVAFCTISEITVLPLHSDELFIPVPIDDDIDDAEVSIRMRQAIVTKESFPELFKAIADIVRGSNGEVSEHLLVTVNGVAIKIHNTGRSTAYALEVL